MVLVVHANVVVVVVPELLPLPPPELLLEPRLHGDEHALCSQEASGLTVGEQLASEAFAWQACIAAAVGS